MAQAVGWQPGRPCRPHAPKPSEHREKAMRTSRAGRHLFTSSNEDSEEDEPEERRAHPREPWLAPVHASVERDLVWGGYINSTARGKPLSEEGKHKIEREVNDFHSEWMNSPSPKCCGGLHHPAGSFFVSQNGHGDTLGRPEFTKERINYKLCNITTTYIMVTN